MRCPVEVTPRHSWHSPLLTLLLNSLDLFPSSPVVLAGLQSLRYNYELRYTRASFCALATETVGDNSDIDKDDPINHPREFSMREEASLDVEGIPEIALLAHVILHFSKDIIEKQKAPTLEAWVSMVDFRKVLGSSNLAYLVAEYEQHINNWRRRTNFMKDNNGQEPKKAKHITAMPGQTKRLTHRRRTKAEMWGEIPTVGYKHAGYGLSSKIGQRRYRSLHR